jgi:2-hydroxychromene-2-carboxylate isomerase
MIEQQVSTIDYYVWLLSDWAYLGGVRFMQLAARHRLKINYIPMRMQDVYAGSGGYPARESFVAETGVPHQRIETVAFQARYSAEH